MPNITSTSKSKIPFFGIKRQYQNIKEEILEVTNEVYTSGQVLDGEYTREFEKAIAGRTQRKYAIAVNSGTTAIILALRAIRRVHSGRNILIPAQSFIATLNSTYFSGHNPVISDVDPVTGMMDLTKLPHPQHFDAIMYVNLFGNMIDYSDLKLRCHFFSNERHPIIEDAAQSFGAWYDDHPSGSFGDFSILSFDPTKNLPNYGSGGMVLTNDEQYADLIRNFRDNGKPSNHTIVGGNTKMSESDCAQMLVKLKHFDSWQARRDDIAKYYMSQIKESMLIPVNAKVRHAWSKFVIHCDRDYIRGALGHCGFETKVHYKKSLNHYDFLTHPTYVLDGEETFSQTCLSLPIYPELTDNEVELIAGTVKNWPGR